MVRNHEVRGSIPLFSTTKKGVPLALFFRVGKLEIEPLKGVKIPLPFFRRLQSAMEKRTA